MILRLNRRRRATTCVLGLCLHLLGSSLAFAANTFVTPSGSGDLSGSGWDHALPASALQTALDSLHPGDTLHIGSGTYRQIQPISIAGHGTPDAPIVLTGVDTGEGLPLFLGDYDVKDTVGAYAQPFIQFLGAASHWKIGNLRLARYGVGVQMAAVGTTSDLRTHLRFENIDGEYVEDFFRLQNASDIEVRNCDVVRYTKKGFRYADHIERLTFVACTADANGGDDTFPTRAIPNGFCGGDTDDEPRIRNVTLIDCTARNNRYAPQLRPYWNGDGFSTEEGTIQVTYIRCASYDNHDGGFDDKADNVTYVDCISIGNTKGFRYWGNNGLYQNCLSAYNQPGGGTNASVGLWVGRQRNGKQGVARVFGSTFFQNGEMAFQAYNGGRITATGCLIVTDPQTAESRVVNEGEVRLINCDAYSNNDDTRPALFAPRRDWQGDPADAFDPQDEQTKGYRSRHRTSARLPTS